MVTFKVFSNWMGALTCELGRTIRRVGGCPPPTFPKYLLGAEYYMNHFKIFIIIYFIFMEKAMAPHSSTLAWKIPWTEEPDRLQSMGSLGVRHDWAASLSLFTFMHWRRKWQPTPVFLPENPRDGGARWAAVYVVAQSWTRLKQLSSSSRLHFHNSHLR